MRVAALCRGLLAGSLVFVPLGVLWILSVVGLALLSAGGTDKGEYTTVLLGASFCTVVCVPLLIAEYFSVFRRSINATLVISVFFLWFAANGILGLVGLLAGDGDSSDWITILGFSVVVAYMAIVGFVHLRRWRAFKKNASARPPAV
ncbi:MAG TPA: hypothetical protein VM186_13105 [Planctomycetota bacterium]|nr:hypothetical protein [Planctomycetota bacterium]